MADGSQLILLSISSLYIAFSFASSPHKSTQHQNFCLNRFTHIAKATGFFTLNITFCVPAQHLTQVRILSRDHLRYGPSVTPAYKHTTIRRNFEHIHFFQLHSFEFSAGLLFFHGLKEVQMVEISSYRRTLVLLCHVRNINGFDLTTKYLLIQELFMTEDKFETGPDFGSVSAS